MPPLASQANHENGRETEYVEPSVLRRSSDDPLRGSPDVYLHACSRHLQHLRAEPLSHRLQVFRINRPVPVARHDINPMVIVGKLPNRKVVRAVFRLDSLDDRNALLHRYQSVFVAKHKEGWPAQRPERRDRVVNRLALEPNQAATNRLAELIRCWQGTERVVLLRSRLPKPRLRLCILQLAFNLLVVTPGRHVVPDVTAHGTGGADITLGDASV